MIGNMLNDLAEAIRRWTEKKTGRGHASDETHWHKDKAKRVGTHKEKRYVLTFMFKLLGRKSACKTFAGSNETLMADPIFGSKYGPQNEVQNWITFSFLLGLCLGPRFGSRFGPKSEASHRKILLLPADVLQADLRRTSMSVKC